MSPLRVLRLLVPVLAVLLVSSACDQRAYHPIEGTGPSSGSGEEAPGPPAQKPASTYEVIRATCLCKGQNAKLYLRDRTKEDEQTFQERIRSGKIVPLEVGTRLEVDYANPVRVNMLDGQSVRFFRATVLGGDEDGVRGMVAERDLAPVR
jgi:hypothetical protein